MMTIEQSPGPYAGALDLCGAVTDTLSRIGRRFDLRVLFDYYFPGPAGSGQDYCQLEGTSEDLEKKVSASLEADPPAAWVLRDFVGLHNDKDLTGLLCSSNMVLKRSGTAGGR